MRIFLAIFMLCTFFSSAVLAHPPSDIKLSYNKESSVLNIQMRHVTRNVRKHFIWKIDIFRNGMEVDSIRFVKQASPTMHEANINVSAEGNDKISIEAFCYEAGIGNASIVVPEDEDEKEDKEKNSKGSSSDGSGNMR